MKKITLLMSLLILAMAVCGCTDNKPTNTETPKTENKEETLQGTEKLIADFLATVKDEEPKEVEVEKDSTPITDHFEVPYQYDLSEYIEIEKADYFGIKLENAEHEITAEDMLEAVESDLMQYGETADVTDRGAEYGDSLNIDFAGYESGVAFEGGTATDYELVLGEAGFIDGFEEQLVGHKTGEEFTIDVVFPENYSEPLAGKPAQFEIKINSIKATVPAELTDDFAKEAFFCETVNDYLLQKYRELTETNRLEADNALKTAAYNTIRENANIKSIPQEQYDAYYNLYVDDFTRSAQDYYGMDLESFITGMYGITMDEFYSYAEESSTAVVEQEIIIFSIANAEGLWQKLTKGDYDAHLESLASTYGMDAATFEETYNTDDIWKSLIMETTIEFVVDNAVIE